MLSKIQAFFHSRVAAAEKWDVALFRLTMDRTTDSNFHWIMGGTLHSPSCLSGFNYPQCRCVRAFQLCRHTFNYQEYLPGLTRPAVDQIISKEPIDFPRHAADILKFILSIGETSERAEELVYFIPVYGYPLFSAAVSY